MSGRLKHREPEAVPTWQHDDDDPSEWELLAEEAFAEEFERELLASED